MNQARSKWAAFGTFRQKYLQYNRQVITYYFHERARERGEKIAVKSSKQTVDVALPFHPMDRRDKWTNCSLTATALVTTFIQ